jgi:TolB-like protein/Tfp pilus assembly protein PilF
MLDMADDQPFLLPVLIDDTPEPAARVPDRFRERQWTRLPGGVVAAGFVERVARLLAGGPALPDATPVITQPSAPAARAVRDDDGFWVAVLPFAHGGTDPGIATLADGLSEGIVTGMSRFSYLRVVARGATLRYGSTATDARSAGQELGARYVMEGSVRQAGNKVRIAVQLVDANSGANLWAETYDRSFDPAAVFDLQDELVPRVVATVADMHGILPRSMSATLRTRDPAQLSPYEAVLRSFAYSERVTADELATARHGVELAVRKAPDYADAWAMLAWLCLQDHAQGFGIRADSLAQGLAAARRAVEAAPSNHLAHAGLAQAFYFRKEFESFRNSAERAVALNPMDGYSIAFLGELLTYTGDWKRGLELAGRAKQINPHHPGWYWYADAYHAHCQRDFRGAIACLLRANMPGHWGFHAMLAAAHGQLGERDAAGKALHELLRLRPDFAATVRAELAKWWTPEYVQHFIDGLRKAGLEIAAADEASPALPESSKSPAPTPVTARGDDGFRVAVLPFKCRGTDNALTALAEGLAEDIVTGLSRFSYLRVISRGSTLHFTDAAFDVRTTGTELGARYVLEGSLRQAGAQLRVAVQLVDAATGAHLWAETYERAFRSEDLFALQDDLVPRIVSTVADMHGVLPRSMSDAVRNKAADQLTPYEALLHSFGYNERWTTAALAEARTCLERAVQQDPGNGDCWAMLSLMYSNEFGHWDIRDPATFEKALRAARTAVLLAPLHSLAHYALAQVLFFRREFPAARTAAERAVSLNPLDAATAAFMGLLIAYSGDWPRGCELADRGLKLNPNLPGMYNYTAWHDAYGRKDYRRALDLALKLNTPDNFYQHAVLAMCYAQLGEMDAAHKSLQQTLSLKPDYGKVARQLHGKWIQPELVEQLMEGLRKAGLEVAPRPL